jgi:antitoxin HigA-1
MSKSSITTRRMATEGLAMPDRVTTHPGKVLSEEFLKPLGMSVNALAMALRVPATRIGAIIKGERSVTADSALRLARFFRTSPEFWMGLQAMHDLTKARKEHGLAIERDVQPHAAA